MNILFVAVDKGGHFASFVEEQLEAVRACSTDVEPIVVERFFVRGKGIMGYLKQLPALCRTIRSKHIDVIHAHYGLCCLLANLQRHVPVVSTYHGSDINSPKVFRFTKRAMRLSAHNIFVSQRTMDIAFLSPTFTDIHRPLAFTRSSLLPCGINLPSERNEYMTQWVDGVLEPDKKHVLFAGAFDNGVKDPQLAKQVVEVAQKQMSEIREQGTGVQCTVYGVQATGDRIQGTGNRQQGMGIQLIELKGYTRAQVTALMYACDAFLMTSKTEGSPQVIKEAMACGCPIVSTDVGDVRERLTLSPSFTDIHPHSPSNTGLLPGCYVASGRDPEELAALLQQALAYGQRTDGRQLIINAGLTNDVVAKRLVELYKLVRVRKQDCMNRLPRSC